MNVAIVHYWLVGMRGGERVLEIFADLFPDADIFTLVLDRATLSETLRSRNIKTSFLQRIGGKKHYQKMLPLMPFALENLDLTPYDLVISSEAGPAKGVITRPDSIHICYCHSPMRYIWDLYHQYRERSGLITRTALTLIAPILRQWDVTTAARVDYFIANSTFVAKRIKKFYRREAVVVNPPVDISRFSISEQVDDFYLCAGQITPYKNIELAVETFNQLGLPLIVIGEGATKRLVQSAHANVTFLGAVDDSVMANHFARCRALVFPGLEDFGIVPLEVMASGRPVIAYAAGGALETVRPAVTGILFNQQTVESLSEAVLQMELRVAEFDPYVIRAFAETFGIERCREQLRSYIYSLVNISS